MNKRLFTQEQIASLLENEHVVRVSERSVTYSPDFKIAAVKRWKEGLPPSAIFTEAGFNLTVIGRKTPKWLVTRWRKTFDKKGATSLQKDHRGRSSTGRPPSLANMTEKEKLKYLEAQVAYLKEENAFLAKLRKQRLN